MLSTLQTVAIKCYNVGVLQSGSRANDIQELFLFSERQARQVYTLHGQNLQQQKEKKEKQMLYNLKVTV